MIAVGLDELVRAVGGRLSEPCGPFRRRGVSPRPLGVTGVSTDSRTLQPGEVFVALAGETFDGHDFLSQAFAKGARAAMVAQRSVREGEAPAESIGQTARLEARPPTPVGEAPAEPARSGPLILVDDPRAALGRLAAYYRRRMPAKIIAVTGSNGKTTTKGMIDHVLGTCLPGRAAQKSFNNDVGVPLTLLSAEPSDRYLVVEIGANAPGEIAPLAAMASPDIAVVTSIGKAHLEGFGDIEGVAREKLSLLEHVEPGGLAVLNLDDLRAVPHGSLPARLKTVTYGTDPEADVRITGVECRLEGVTFRINDRYAVRLPVPGLHNARNAAAVFAVARRMQLEPEQIVEALATVRLPHLRLNVRRLGGFTLIEDCYNANPTSMAASIEVLRGVESARRVLVVGEMRELGTSSEALHTEVGVLAGQAGIDLVVSVGSGARAVLEGARSARRSIATRDCETTEQACAEVPPLLAAGDAVLIKGSRAMGLERLTERIAERFAARTTVGAEETED